MATHATTIPRMTNMQAPMFRMTEVWHSTFGVVVAYISSGHLGTSENLGNLGLFALNKVYLVRLDSHHE